MGKVFKDKLGQTGNSSPSAAQNAEHIHSAGVKKVSQTLPANAAVFIPDSTVATGVNGGEVIRCANTTGAVAFVAVVEQGTTPALNATDSFAIMPNSVELIAVGELKSGKGQEISASAAGVQLVILDSALRK